MKLPVLHIIGMPHTADSADYCHCAYSSKNYRAVKMFGQRGHEVILYANEGSDTRGYGEHVQILSEEERASWFGSHDKQRLYHLLWDANQPYWKLFNERAIAALKPRVKKGDFILSLSGNCHQPIANEFPNSYHGITNGPMWVEWGVGYFGTISKYVVYESETHRAWMRGAAGLKTENYFDAAIPNFFDMEDFQPQTDETLDIGGYTVDRSPYFLFIGRIVDDKGWRIAVDVCKRIGAELVLAGQGDTGELPPHCRFVGHANIPQRNWLMQNATATFTPTNFSEPFGGTAVETQLCGTPAISTDHGAFTETVERKWRCSTMRQFVEAAEAASELRPNRRRDIRQRAQALYSLESVAPLYEAYFARLYALWSEGFYYMGEPEDIKLPPG